MRLRKQFRNTADSRDPRYKLKQWKLFRLVILKRDCWACQMCGVALVTGRTSRLSAVVDHLVPAWPNTMPEDIRQAIEAADQDAWRTPFRSWVKRHGLRLELTWWADLERRMGEQDQWRWPPLAQDRWLGMKEWLERYEVPAPAKLPVRPELPDAWK